MIRFCYASDSGSDVWSLPNEVALANCDFSNATQICNTTTGSDEDCCNFFVEEDTLLQTYFFASQQGCEQGQRVAVQVEDFDDVADSCYNSGLTTSRIKTCDCLFEDRASTLVEPCHSQFALGCLEGSPTDLSCCDNGDCVALAKNVSTPEGSAAEEARQSLCNDNIPGKCATGSGVDDCCTRVCSECGTGLHPDADWSSCSAGSAEFANGTCGFTPSFEPYTCDFSACSDQDPWHPNGSAFQRWLGIAEETPIPSRAPAVAPVAPAPTSPASVPAAPQLPMSPSGEASSAAGLPAAHVSFAVVVTTCAMLCGLLCADFLSKNWFR